MKPVLYEGDILRISRAFALAVLDMTSGPQPRPECVRVVGVDEFDGAKVLKVERID